MARDTPARSPIRLELTGCEVPEKSVAVSYGIFQNCSAYPAIFKHIPFVFRTR